MNIVSLSEIKINVWSVIHKIEMDNAFKERFYELGFIPGNKIKMLYKDVFNNTFAFLVCNTVIALRKETCEKIFVQEGKYFDSE